MECGAETAVAAAPGRGHRPGAALGGTGVMQVTFQRGRPLSGRKRVRAREAGGTCNHGSRGPGPSDTPPPRPGLPGRRALTCTASRSPRGLSGFGCAGQIALGTVLGVPRRERQQSGGRRRPGRRRRRRRTPALRSGETHPPPGRSAAAAPDHFRGAGERGGAPPGTSCRGAGKTMAAANKGSAARARRSAITAWRPHGDSLSLRGAITSQRLAGVLVLRRLRLLRTQRGSWGKRGGGGRHLASGGCWGSLGRHFPFSLRCGLSQIKSGEVGGSPLLVGGLGGYPEELASADGLVVPFGGDLSPPSRLDTVPR